MSQITGADGNTITSQTNGVSESLDIITEDKTSLSNNITALNQTVVLDSRGMGSVIVQVTGTFSATLTLEATVDGTNWFDWYGMSNQLIAQTGTITAPDQVILPVTGVQQVRVICTAYTSGTAVVSMAANQSFSGQVSAFTSSTLGTFPVEIIGALTIGQGTAATLSGAWPVIPTDGTHSQGYTAGGEAKVSITEALPVGSNQIGSVAQSGAWTISSGSVTVAGTVTANAGTNLNTSLLALESGGNLASIKADVDNLALSQASTTSGQKGNLTFGAVTTNAPSYSTSQSDPLSLDTSGNLRVSLKDSPQNTNKFLVTADAITFASAQPVTQSGTWTNTVTQATGTNLHTVVDSGTVTANAGTGTFTVGQATGTNLHTVIDSGTITTVTTLTGITNALPAGTNTIGAVEITDGTNGNAAVKAASTAAVTGDKSFVVALSPNSPIPTGSNTIGALTANQSVNLAQVAGTTTVTAGVSGLLAVGGNVAAGSAVAGNPVQIAGSDGTDVRAVSTTLKGTQGAYGVSTQDLKDSGRTYKVFYIDRIAGVITTEALSTMNINSSSTVTTGTSYTVTAGKTLRLQSFSASIEDSTTTAVSGRIRVRAAGTVSATSGIIINLDVPLVLGTAAAGAGSFTQMSIPDGIEIAGGQEIGISQLVSSASSTVSCCLVGYEY